MLFVVLRGQNWNKAGLRPARSQFCPLMCMYIYAHRVIKSVPEKIYFLKRDETRETILFRLALLFSFFSGVIGARCL